MKAIRLLAIDDSNRGHHPFLQEKHECYFFYDYTAGKKAAYSDGNQLILNIKKPVSEKDLPHYKYKNEAINDAGAMLNAVFKKAPKTLKSAVVVPVPPSKIRSDSNYDDRMWRVVNLACKEVETEKLELIEQLQTYASSHKQPSGTRMRPDQLRDNYKLSHPVTQRTVILVDDVLTTGAHFVACHDLIKNAQPEARVIGFFLARRVPPSDFDEF